MIAFGVTMPSLINQFFSRNLGAQSIVNQCMVDLLSLVENNRDIVEVDLFSLFVRELYDEDAFVFFLYARSIGEF